jgi:SAM-dependent methyltransferase
VVNPHGALNSALKNNAPLNLTALRMAEKASIQEPWIPCTIVRTRGKDNPSIGRSSKRWGRWGMVMLTVALYFPPRHGGQSMNPNPNQALWEKGDFTRIASTMRESGDAIVGNLGIAAGMKVLDLGCGDGTTALPAARRGADVLGVDIARNLVDAGNKRARAEGLANCRFQHGDATNLSDLDDRRFDLVISIFGAMFAPKPFDVAKEMVRVTRPGGRIVMGNWIPGDPTLVAQILKISSAYSPPPPEGFISPMTWGIESHVVDRFTSAGVPGERISFAKDTYVFNAPVPPAAFVADFRNYYGPTMNAFAAAEQAGKSSALQQELEALFERENRSANGSTSIPATFLCVTVSV